MGEPAVVTEGLRKRFGNVIALDGVDLQAEQGTVLSLLGPNGAGKTTTVRILTTPLPPDEGRANPWRSGATGGPSDRLAGGLPIFVN